VPLAIALRFAPCHNRLCGSVSPLTASVNENSVFAIDVLDALDELVVTVEDLVVEVVFELVEPEAHAVSATTIAQNLMNRRK
jgi:hypothetical protein